MRNPRGRVYNCDDISNGDGLRKNGEGCLEMEGKCPWKCGALTGVGVEGGDGCSRLDPTRGWCRFSFEMFESGVSSNVAFSFIGWESLT